MLILQRLYNISDAELEYQVNDRLSFMEFLGLGLEAEVLFHLFTDLKKGHSHRDP
jgi:IS5 family transposase